MAEVFDIFEMENAMGTWKRHRLISNESTDSKRRKCGRFIYGFIKLKFRIERYHKRFVSFNR